MTASHPAAACFADCGICGSRILGIRPFAMPLGRGALGTGESHFSGGFWFLNWAMNRKRPWLCWVNVGKCRWIYHTLSLGDIILTIIPRFWYNVNFKTRGKNASFVDVSASASLKYLYKLKLSGTTKLLVWKKPIPKNKQLWPSKNEGMGLIHSFRRVLLDLQTTSDLRSQILRE